MTQLPLLYSGGKEFHALKLSRSSDNRIMLFASSAPPTQPGAEIGQYFVSIRFADGGETTWTRAVRSEKGRESAHSGG
jgi:hypothetical protein